MFNFRQFWCLVFVFHSVLLSAQSFSKNIEKTVLTLPGKEVAGFTTSFEFNKETVRLSWWKYARRFAIPLNQRTHYEVTIPASKDSRQMVIYTQLGDRESAPVQFKLGLHTEGMSEEEKKKFEDQSKALLLDFKRWHYLRHFEEQMEKLEKEFSKKRSQNWDEWMQFVNQRQTIIERMKEI